MVDDLGTAEMCPATNELSRSASAARMRQHRERRRKRMRCLTIELRDSEIEALIRRGRLHPDHRANSAAVRKALYGFFDQYLV
jgi:hypothetical protein